MGNACCVGSESKPKRRKRESNTSGPFHSLTDSEDRPSRRASEKSMSGHGGIRKITAYKTPQHNRNSTWHKRIKTTSVVEAYSLEDSLESTFHSTLLNVRWNAVAGRSSRLLTFDASTYGQQSTKSKSLHALRRVVKYKEVAPTGRVISNCQDVHKECDMHEHLFSTNQPCCLKLVEVFEDAEAYSLILEPVPKSSLLELMLQATSNVHHQKAESREDLAAYVVFQLAQCLARAHHKMVVYRNLCPDSVLCLDPPTKSIPRPSEGGSFANIGSSFSLPALLTPRTIQRELSASLSKLALVPWSSTSNQSRLVLSGLDQAVFIHKGNQGCVSIRGSTLFAAPEMVKKHLAKGDPNVPFYSKEVDLWALGILMSTILYGRFPFSGECYTSTYQQILSGDPARGEHDELMDISQDAKSLLNLLLKPDPSDRLTATQVLEHPFITSHLNGAKSRSKSDDIAGNHLVSQPQNERWRRQSHQLWSALSSLRTVYSQALRFCDSLFPLPKLITAFDSLQSILRKHPHLGSLSVTNEEISSYLYEKTTFDSFMIRNIMEAMSPNICCIQNVESLLASVISLASYSYDRLQVRVVYCIQSNDMAPESISTRDILDIIAISDTNDASVPEATATVDPSPSASIPLHQLSALSTSTRHSQALRSRLQVSSSSSDPHSAKPSLLMSDPDPPAPATLVALPGPRPSSPLATLRGRSPPSPRSSLLLSPSSSRRNSSSSRIAQISKTLQPTLMLEDEAVAVQPQAESINQLARNSGSLRKIDLTPSSPKVRAVSLRESLDQPPLAASGLPDLEHHLGSGYFQQLLPHETSRASSDTRLMHKPMSPSEQPANHLTPCRLVAWEEEA